MAIENIMFSMAIACREPHSGLIFRMFFGFLDDRHSFDINRSIQPSTDCFDKIYKGMKKKQSIVFAMIDYGTCSIDNISPCADSFIDGIRVIFKKINYLKAIQFGKQLMDKGYRVCLQMVSITAYSDKDVIQFVEEVNEINPYTVSIVDTYGLLHAKNVLHYFELLNHNLNESIILGYHAHNNFQLAYSNCTEIAKQRVERDIILDATLYGMGKSAGNAALELIIMFMNKELGAKYDINPVLEAIDTHILKIYHQKYWGYNLLFYLSASNDCHPKYVEYLLNKKMITVKAVNNMIGLIPPEFKLDYSEKQIEAIYLQYQNSANSHYTDNSDVFFDEISSENILLIGPGKSIVADQDKIKSYIQEKSPTVISVNFLPRHLDSSYIFISNAKRSELITLEYEQLNAQIPIAVTNNAITERNIYKYILNYKHLLDENPIIQDNGLIMLLNGLIRHGIKQVTIAGFDGFSMESIGSYYSEYLELSNNYDQLMLINTNIKERIAAMRQNIEISFLTKSLYHEENE